MAGGKSRIRDSLQLRLSFALALAILVVASVAGIIAFVAAFDEAHELQDDVLRQVGALFDREHLPLPHPGDAGRGGDSDEQSRVIVEYLGNDKSLNAATPLALPADLADGLQTLALGGVAYRLLARTLGNGERIVVAQSTRVRDEIARDSALRTVMPFLVLVPVLLLVVADLVKKMFRPITALATELDQREERELHPLATTELPTEVRPFVVAINRLLERIAQAMESQRRFVADAAHELRSPLAALSLQAERLAAAEMSLPAQQRLATLRCGILRNRDMLDQLLSLARVQSPPVQPTTPISMLDIYRRVLEDLLPLADAKGIDIGVEGEQDGHLLVHPMDLIAMIENLVDNAIRYTPPGGRIDLALIRGEARVAFQIRDTGPGIALAEYDRVFDPFYRIIGSEQPGSGLGLAIVKTVAERIGAEVGLAWADPATRRGLAVTVAFSTAIAGTPSSGRQP